MDKNLYIEGEIMKLREQFLKGGDKKLSNFAIVTDKGANITSDICHAKIRWGVAKGEKSLGIFDWPLSQGSHGYKISGKGNLAAYAKLVAWVVNRGPLKGTGKRTSIKRVLQEGVWFSSNKSASAILSTITMYRTHREFPGALEAFKELLALGVSYEAAWFVSSCITEAYGEGKYRARGWGGHDVFRYDHRLEDIIEFLAGKREFPKEEPYSLSTFYKVNAYCGGSTKEEGELAYEWIRKWFSPGQRKKKFGKIQEDWVGLDVLFEASKEIQKMIDERKSSA